MEIMPSMQKSTLLLYIVVWSCQIFYIIKVMPFCNRTFQTYAPASSTAGQSCVGQWQNQTSHQNLDFGYSEQYYEEIDLQNHVTQHFFPIFLLYLKNTQFQFLFKPFFDTNIPKFLGIRLITTAPVVESGTRTQADKEIDKDPQKVPMASKLCVSFLQKSLKVVIIQFSKKALGCFIYEFFLFMMQKQFELPTYMH